MSLPCLNECVPNALRDLELHKEVNDLLLSMVENNMCQHLLMHGPRGAGKLLRCRLFIKELYREATLGMRHEVISISPQTEVNVINGKHHTEVFATSLNLGDRKCIQEVVKQLGALQPQINFSGTSSAVCYRIFVIVDANQLSVEAQASLRRTLEKNSQQTRFILITEDLSGIIAPIRSRCVSIRVPSPNIDEAVVLLKEIARTAGKPVTSGILTQIASVCNGDMLMARIALQRYIEEHTLVLPYWVDAVTQIRNTLIESPDAAALLRVRTLLYELFVKCVDFASLLDRLLFQLLADNRVPEQKYASICKVFGHYASLANNNSRPLVHIMACFSYIMYILASSQ